MPKEAIELLLFFVLLFKSGFQSSDYCWNTDSGKLEVNNRKPRKYCLKGFYKGINSKSKRSDTASLTWSVLLPSYKAQGRKFWQDIWRFSRGHQKISYTPYLSTPSQRKLPSEEMQSSQLMRGGNVLLCFFLISTSSSHRPKEILLWQALWIHAVLPLCYKYSILCLQIISQIITIYATFSSAYLK